MSNLEKLDLNVLITKALNYGLTDCLKNASNRELTALKAQIEANDIVEIKVSIYEAILTEIEYRKLYNNMVIESDEDISKILTDYSDSETRNYISSEDIQKSINFYNSLGVDYKNGILFFPCGISIDLIHRAYNRNKNINDEIIMSKLATDLDSMVAYDRFTTENLNSHLNIMPSKSYEDDEDFKNFIIKAFSNVPKVNKSKTKIKK